MRPGTSEADTDRKGDGNMRGNVQHMLPSLLSKLVRYNPPLGLLFSILHRQFRCFALISPNLLLVEFHTGYTSLAKDRHNINVLHEQSGIPFPGAKYQAVEVHRRTSKGWTDSQYCEPGDEIELTSLDIHFPIEALYRGAGIPETIDEPEGEF